MRGNQSQVIGQALLGSLFDAEGLPSLPGMIIPTTVPARLSRMRWHNSYREAGVEVGSISLVRGPSANFKERDSGKFAIRPTCTSNRGLRLVKWSDPSHAVLLYFMPCSRARACMIGHSRCTSNYTLIFIARDVAEFSSQSHCKLSTTVP